MRESRCLDRTILVGKKGIARYVLAGLYKVFIEQCSSVRYAALGKSIYRAVSAAEALSRLLGFLYIKRVQISSLIVSGEGKTRRVSRIEIELHRIDEEP
ncbi:MAG: RNA-binding protein [Crenarchaeota archaeon]|nr:RNA-binding protein [Thermoproteota archaeon]